MTDTATPRRLTLLQHHDVMIDFETGGIPVSKAMLLQNGSMAPPVFLSIGAVVFNPYDSKPNPDLMREFMFYRNVEPNSCLELGGKYDPATLRWWKQQDPEAVASLKENRQPVKKVLEDFFLWISNFRAPIHVQWANDPSFDLVLLKHWCILANVTYTFKYGNEGSCRTIKRLAWPDSPVPNFHEGVAHNAGEDCIGQGLTVQAAHYLLNLRRR